MALETIGLIADVLGLASLANDAFQPQQASGTGVSIKLGFGDGSDGVTGFDGSINDAYAFDYSNNYLGQGSAPAGNADGGAVVAITIAQDDPDRQGRFVGIDVGDDDVCVLFVTVNQHDGGYQGTWNGDIGFNCGQAYYHGGGDVVGTIGDDNEPWAPRCTWFGPGDSHGAVANSWKFNTLAYGSGSNQTLSDNSVCGATLYATDGEIISDEPAGIDTAAKKRSVGSLPLPAVRPAWMEETLIISSITSQTAKELCTEGMSWGPDFIDAKGDYCDMETKTLSPLCTATNSTSCVTWSNDVQTISKRSSVARRSVDTVHKSYSSVRRWGQK